MPKPKWTLYDILTAEERQEWYERRIKPNIVVADNGCWAWNGGKHTDGVKGYPKVILWLKKSKKKLYLFVHRVTYECVVGRIEPGMCLDHLCVTQWCVNPSHLEQTTIQTNTLRGNAVLFKRYQTSPEPEPVAPEDIIT